MQPDKDFGINFPDIMNTLFNSMPYLFWKSRQGIYLGCNLNQAKAFNFSSPSEIVGKTIYEIIENQEYAKRIDNADNEIMSLEECVTVEEVLPTPFGFKTFMSQKQPLYNKGGEVIGMLGFSTDITKIKEQELLAKNKVEDYKNITEQQKLFKECLDELQHTIQRYKIKGLNQKLGLNSNYNKYSLDIKVTKRENDILYYLSLNKSPKEIAALLSILESKNIQPTTIQSIIDKQLYTKFEVYSVAQLVEKATVLKLIPFMLDQN